MTPTIERLTASIFWPCPYCGEKIDAFPNGPQGHLIQEHSASTTTPTDQIRSRQAEGDEEDTWGKRERLQCPFCSAGDGEYFASFTTQAALKAHLTNQHGCS